MLIKTISITGFLTLFILSGNCQTMQKRNAWKWPENVPAPVAEVKAKELAANGDTRTDNYYWMNDYFKKGADSNEVVDYLAAENKYYDTMMLATKPLQEKLYKEMKARIKEKDESVPVFKNGYYYYNRLVEGKDYFVYCRKKGSLQAAEEVLLDVNTMAEGHNYYAATGFSISPDNRLMAYGIDTLSRRQYKIYIKNLQTGALHEDIIPNTEGAAVWANDNKTIFYTAKNPVTLLSEKIKKHVLGEPSDADKTVYEENDPSNYIGVEKTKSDKYILILSRATLSSEVRWINANKPDDAFEVFQPRIKEILYDVDHANDRFFIRTNLHAKNFRIVTCTEEQKDTSNWKDLVPHNENILIADFDLFKHFLAVSERKGGLTQVHIINTKNNSGYYLSFDEAAYVASIVSSLDYNTDIMRFNYTSLTTPGSVYDYNMITKEKKLMKQQEVVGGYDPTAYTTERLMATAKDGTKVPVSIVYKKRV